MAKPAPKKKKLERSEGAIEATIALRLNSEGAMVDYECGNPDCQEHLSQSEEQDFKDGKITIEAGEEVECGACKAINFNEGFTVSKL